MKITKAEAAFIKKYAVPTGYDPTKDWDYTSQNWHAADDDARATIAFSSLSEETQNRITEKIGHSVSSDATAIFRWNIEWGTLVDIVVGEKFLRSMSVEGLPWPD